MFTQVSCPACGGDRADSDVRCPACGFEVPAEDVVASWVAGATAETQPPSGQEAVCLSCGYEGSLILAPDGDRALCPACGTPWQDRGGILRKVGCPDCRQVILLTEEHRGKTIICPGCHSLMGCLVGRDRHGVGRRMGPDSGGRTTIFELMTFTAALALGIAVILGLCEENDPKLVVQGTSVMALPVCWALSVSRMMGPRLRRGRKFSSPGVAACLAVSIGSLPNLCSAWDLIVSYVGPRSLLLVTMLRAVTPLPLAAAVAGTWVVLVFDRRWRPEPSWIDWAGRCLGVYWLLAGLTLPFARYFFA
jgi:hypothetical protein